LQHDSRAYGVLEDLNIKPRTKYLARIRNVPKRLMTHDQLHPTWNTSPMDHAHGGHGHGEHGHDHDHDHSHDEAKATS
jgi:molybdopterin-containing oxidoreductase family iron-sulfur binding subunit